MPDIQPDLLSAQEAGFLDLQDTDDIKYFGPRKEYRAHRDGTIETRKHKNGNGGLLPYFRPVKITKYRTDKHGGYYWSASCWWVKKRNPRVHVVICSLFHSKTDPAKKEVNHIDGNRDNNHADNLEWCTRLENARNARDRGAFKEINLGSGYLQDDIARFLAVVTQVRAGISNKELSRRYDVHQSVFSNLRLGKSAIAKKYWHIISGRREYFGGELDDLIAMERK